MIHNLTHENFNSEVLESRIPVVIDFQAPWCYNCNAVLPILDEIAEEYKGKVKFCTLNIDDDRPLAEQYGIASIPTFIKFENGKLKKEIFGALPKPALTAQLGL